MLSSCSSQRSEINNLNIQIEELSDVRLLVEETSLPVFQKRNIVIRNDIINKYSSQIKKNKKELFYLIENYNSDWGGIYTTNLIIGEKVFCIRKDGAFKEYSIRECHLYELKYKTIVQLLNERKYAEAKAKFKVEENCLSTTNIFVVTKKFKIVESLTGLHCLESDDSDL